MPDDAKPETDGRETLMRLTTNIVTSFVSKNAVSPDTLPDVIRSVFNTVSSLSAPSFEAVEEKPRPAVPINKSITQHFIICLEDGRKLKMLKRYLRTRYDMSPDDYRKRWGLPADYPMVAPSYTETRSEHAKKIGLGKTGRKDR
jgi:predicted transcriptional regulator